MKPYFQTLLFIFTFCFLKGQINSHSVILTQLPKKTIYKGDLKNAVEFNDVNGKQLVIESETGLYTSKKEEDNKNADLYAYLYQIKNDSIKLVWTIQDHIVNCPVDVVAQFIPQTLIITDLNKNNIAEVWVMYKLVCHGDLSACDMKVIMYEGKQKYAMRGRNKVEYEPNKFDGGEYNFDKAFQNAPKAFRDYALALWNKNLMEKWRND